MTYVSCPLCGMDRPEPLFTARDRLGLSKESHTVVRCGSCGMVYLNPRPDSSEMMGFYPREYWGGREKGLKEKLRAVEERLKEGYKLRALKEAGMHSGKVLDIGCGRGEFMALLRSLGYEPAGLEPGAEAARRGREESGLDIVHGSLGETKLPAERFDAVTFWHVLEHMPEPSGALKEAFKALRPGGVVIVAAPDFSGWQPHAFRENWFGVDAPRHLSHFTRDTLGKILTAAGFSDPRFGHCGFRYETAMLVRSALPGLNRMKLKALEHRRPSRYIYKAAQLMLDSLLLPAGLVLVSAGAGCTIIATAGKPGRGEPVAKNI